MGIWIWQWVKLVRYSCGGCWCYVRGVHGLWGKKVLPLSVQIFAVRTEEDSTIGSNEIFLHVDCWHIWLEKSRPWCFSPLKKSSLHPKRRKSSPVIGVRVNQHRSRDTNGISLDDHESSRTNGFYLFQSTYAHSSTFKCSSVCGACDQCRWWKSKCEGTACLLHRNHIGALGNTRLLRDIDFGRWVKSWIGGNPHTRSVR